MGTGHNHSHATRNERALKVALGLTSAFLLTELIGGVLTQSLALISDAAHMFTDAAALAIGLAAIQIAKRPADARRTFGYYRFEILAAAFNAVMLLGVALYILYEAYRRLSDPPEVQSLGMLAIATVGLVINLISMRMLSAGKEQSLNIKGAYLEVWSDLLGSLGVIAGALIIWLTGWGWVDSAVAVLIGLWVLPRTWVLLKSSLNILLEGVPEDIELDEVKQVLLSVQGVHSLHDLHIWALSSGKISLTVHLVIPPETDVERKILPTVRELLAERFDITHIAIQCEPTPCPQAEASFHLVAASDEHADASINSNHSDLGRPRAGQAHREL
ncbi:MULTISPECIES: cation diffusion facilitator family transporter [Cupriavidus]|uniref:Cobalt-zinc-cadmium resistance protein, cation efflux system n=3 Tax=Cupriavidus TaxID=106589 RepID=A0A375CPP3_9BURK|nr:MULTISPECIES: cation diffusion facilitator family transporter [Cupriavidus]MCO4865615.1 cation diffusion facilitator family transporter [Cupriavidus sp. WGlv3]MCO4893335.1 cation diffusion facilitator family transporter [Cupriavidus sp. WGtm5]ULX55965.1 cation transporter [Cupriavidus taiwanensis]CAP64259.1 Cobalt-zinc-cadmium resistance protein, cation efflux system [Cupriavidus taiwanensis LMG 19424]SOY76586.1 Cobalt-zinc-cadmium resistance protein, cation efflux system [Cupriavidus taiwa